jgi:hypothetical protein
MDIWVMYIGGRSGGGYDAVVELEMETVGAPLE